MNEWIEESYKEGLSFRLALRKRLFADQSPFQKVEVFESSHHGRVLLNDGCFMLSERDERIYHEMMAHVPLHVHPAPKKVLIIGGGDGGTAREVLKHPGVESCTLVEIDEMVVEACKRYIPQTAAIFADPRLKLVIGDGVAFAKDSRETFDVILVDSTDPNGAAQPLFGPEFYGNLAQRLGAGGIVIAQGESAFYEAATQKSLMQIASPLFDWVTMFNFTNMTYPGGLWSFMWASKGVHPLRNVQAPKVKGCSYYNSEVHKAAFALPEFQKQQLFPWMKI
jgi:spermidine synthase